MAPPEPDPGSRPGSRGRMVPAGSPAHAAEDGPGHGPNPGRMPRAPDCTYNTESLRPARTVSNHPLLNIAVRAARQAGNVIARNIDRFDTFAVAEKAENDFVTEIDRIAERRIIDTIRKSHPDHAFLAEESGAHGRHDFEWVIDPLDGTVNFMRGFPHVAVSIGVRRRGRMEHGVVFDPLRQELFMASRGSGARLDDRRLRVSTTGNLRGALIGSGFVTRKLDRLEPYLATLKALISGSAHVRRSGSAALDLAYVAAGRLDGVLELGLAPWDIAAGTLIVQEAGGIVAEPNGGNDYMRSGDVAAANPKVLRAMLRAMGPPAPANRPTETPAKPRSGKSRAK